MKYSKVRIGKLWSDKFPIQNGLKQGDALSPLKNRSHRHSLLRCNWGTGFIFFSLAHKCGYKVPGIILLQAYLYTYSLPRRITFEVFPWAAANLAQRCYHCYRIVFSAFVTFLCF